MNKEVFYIIFSLIGVIALILSIQFKEKKDILFMQIIANFFYGLSYITLNAWSAVATTSISLVKTCTFFKYSKNNKKTPVFWLVFFILLILIIGYITLKNWYDLIPIIITLAYFISTYLDNTKFIRQIFLVCAFLWVIYNTIINNYIILIGNAFEIISASISLWRFKHVTK